MHKTVFSRVPVRQQERGVSTGGRGGAQAPRQDAVGAGSAPRIALKKSRGKRFKKKGGKKKGKPQPHLRERLPQREKKLLITKNA